MTIHLATGIAIKDGCILLVASRYPTHPNVLWNLPGGRVERGELLSEALEREVREETGLDARVRELAYVSESYDGETHFINTAFEMNVSGSISIPHARDHVAEVSWCPLARVEFVMDIAIVRIPLLTYLARGVRYFGTHEAGVTIRWSE